MGLQNKIETFRLLSSDKYYIIMSILCIIFIKTLYSLTSEYVDIQVIPNPLRSTALYVMLLNNIINKRKVIQFTR